MSVVTHTSTDGEFYDMKKLHLEIWKTTSRRALVVTSTEWLKRRSERPVGGRVVEEADRDGSSTTRWD